MVTMKNVTVKKLKMLKTSKLSFDEDATHF